VVTQLMACQEVVRVDEGDLGCLEVMSSGEGKGEGEVKLIREEKFGEVVEKQPKGGRIHHSCGEFAKSSSNCGEFKQIQPNLPKSLNFITSFRSSHLLPLHHITHKPPHPQSKTQCSLQMPGKFMTFACTPFAFFFPTSRSALDETNFALFMTEIDKIMKKVFVSLVCLVLFMKKSSSGAKEDSQFQFSFFSPIEFTTMKLNRCLNEEKEAI
jgi:hypothetical protein